MKIAAGSCLEVLWEVSAGTRKRSVWWGAIFTSAVRGTAASASKSATIRYDGLHGHDPTEGAVRFISSSVLEESEGLGNYVRHSWRWAGTAGADFSEKSDSSSVNKTTEEGARICLPPQSGHVLDICNRVEVLEAQLRDVREILRQDVFTRNRSRCRSLEFARHKLGFQLSMPPYGNSTTVSKYRDSHTIIQGFMTVQVDCILADFASICETVASAESEGIDVYPSLPQVGSSKIDAGYKISFQKYEDLCKALGMYFRSDVAGSLMKIKNGKREQAPISVRVLGVLQQNERCTNVPMVLAGSSINKHLKFSAPVKVLYRKSRLWDEVDGSFTESLKETEMTLSDILAMENGYDLVSTSSMKGNTGESPPGFCITWKRTSNTTERLFEGDEPDAVLGSLEIVLPHVVMRGLAFCADVVRVCTRDFIG